MEKRNLRKVLAESASPYTIRVNKIHIFWNIDSWLLFDLLHHLLCLKSFLEKFPEEQWNFYNELRLFDEHDLLNLEKDLEFLWSLLVYVWYLMHKIRSWRLIVYNSSSQPYNIYNIFSKLVSVSYTHLTLPTICSV